MADETTSQSSVPGVSATQISIVPINPLDHIEDHRPTAETAKTVANWYATETMELNFGDYVGRPNENVVAHREQLSALFADGWYVVAVSNSQASGEWQKVTTRSETQMLKQLGSDLDRMLGCSFSSRSEIEHGLSTSNRTDRGTDRSTEKSLDKSTETGLDKSTENRLVVGTENSKATETETGSSKDHELGKTTESAAQNAHGTSQSSSQSSSQASSQSSSQSSSQNSSQTSAQASSKSKSLTRAGFNVWYARDQTSTQASGTSNSTNNGTANAVSTGTANDKANEKATGTSQDSYQDSTQSSTQRSSQSSTQRSSQSSSQRSSQSSSQQSTQSSTQRSTQSSTQRSTQSSTQRSTQSSTQESGQTSTQLSSQASTQESSQRSTQRSSQESTQFSSTITEDGDPYYCTWMRIKLQRKRMQSDKVLQSMVDTLVSQFNDGRTINIDRYDELVSLYALLLNRVETEGNALLDDGVDFMPFFDDIKAKVEDALAKLAEVAEDLPDDWMQSRIDEINRRFDALKGQEMAKYTSAGMWNSSMSASVNAGVERERQYALNDLRDEMVTLKIEAFGKIADITASVGNNLIGAQVRIFEALQQKKIEPINMRNTVFKWMLDFMERREDPYPQIDELPTVAERLGYSGGIAFPSQQGS